MPKYILTHALGSESEKRFGKYEFVHGSYVNISSKVRILEMPVISATNLRHFCPLPWNPDAESLNHVCLIAVGGSRFELLSSIHLEIIDNWPTDDFLNRVTVG